MTCGGEDGQQADACDNTSRSWNVKIRLLKNRISYTHDNPSL